MGLKKEEETRVGGQNRGKAEGEVGNRTSGKLKQSDTAKHGEKNKSLRLRGTSPSIIVN